jgi:hypothetical protein
MHEKGNQKMIVSIIRIKTRFGNTREFLCMGTLNWNIEIDNVHYRGDLP